jgi:hypothetical protein
MAWILSRLTTLLLSELLGRFSIAQTQSVCVGSTVQRVRRELWIKRTLALLLRLVFRRMTKS